jgi:catechol 2,3-dioxygenase-like lactoylglutathione lyase family enzyme
MRLAAITFVVRDYDEAIQWFTHVLGFILMEDTPLPGAKRWIRVQAPSGGVSLLLAKAEGELQLNAVGQAAGGRVAYFLEVSDFTAAYGRMKTAGIRFLEEPRHETYGTIAVFEDLYGNKWDLIEPQSSP